MSAFAPHELEFCRRFVYENAGLQLDERKNYLFESRLCVVLEEFGLVNMAQLVERMQAAGADALRTRVVDAMTTNESSFFRDAHPFDALRDFVLPAFLKARRKQRELTIWSAACSTGQEPYSLAVLLRHAVPELAGWRVRVLATDLSDRVLAKARAGVYTDTEARRGMPENLLERYFERQGGDWRVCSEIRQMIEFRALNLITAWPAIGTMDIVFLRNVLIYFDVETKRRILGEVRRVLAPDGLLCLGAAETVLGIRKDFRQERLGRTTFYGPVDDSEAGD